MKNTKQNTGLADAIYRSAGLKKSNTKLYPVRLQLLLSTEQYRKLRELAGDRSMGAVLRSLLDTAK